MKDAYWSLVLPLVIGIVLIIVIFYIPSNKLEYIYECTDYKGDLIYCESAYTSKGGMFGIMEDGTKIVITSYKIILEEERNK